MRRRKLRLYRRRVNRRPRSNIMIVPSIRPICIKFYKFTKMMAFNWQFGASFSDNQYQRIPVTDWKIFEGRQVPQIIDVYGQYIVNKVKIVLRNIEIQRYYVIGDIKKSGDRVLNQIPDPLFSQSTFTLSTLFKNDSRFGTPLLDQSYEYCKKHKLYNGKIISWNYYPRCTKRSGSMALTINTTLNDMLVACQSRDLTPQRCSMFVGFELSDDIVPKQNDIKSYQSYVLTFVVDVYVKFTFTDRNIDGTCW